MGDQVYTHGGPAGRAFSALPAAGLLLALLALLAAVLSGAGTRWQWWGFRSGFAILKWAAYGGVASAIISFLGFISGLRSSRRAAALSVIGIIIGLIVLYVPWHWYGTARAVPAIHDITTDTDNPPQFVALLPLRRLSPNGAQYGGAQIAEKQHAAYPDILPLELPVKPQDAFDRALMAAKKMNWEIADANSTEGRIEAVDATFWFGFKDDIVIRITPLPNGTSRVDARSVSRVGVSDIGTNAKRVRKYLKVLSRK